MIPASCVDALDGAPGIFSARWAGPDKDFRRRDDAGRAAAAGARRHDAGRSASAHFVSALCVAWPDGHLEEVEARVDGTLVWPPRGTAGFGYDPIFLPDGHARTFGEMTSLEKHGLPPLGLGLSHRARAFVKAARRSASTAADRKPAFGVYVHWPFCLSKCPYCDFNSHVRHAPIDEERFVRAFAREIETTAARAPGRVVSLDLSRRRHAVADEAANRRRDPRCDRQALARRRRRRNHARSQPDQRRGDALSRLSRRRRQPRLARRAGARRCAR